MTTHPGKRFILLASLLTAALGVVLLLKPGGSQPTYQGRRLSTWLDELAETGGSRPGAPLSRQARSVRAIGTNALPWLLSEFAWNEPRWHGHLNRLLQKQRITNFRFGGTLRRHRRAILGFQTLGEMAEPAIPDLLRLIEVRHGLVPIALAGIGAPAIPALAQCLTNTSSLTSNNFLIGTIRSGAVGAVHQAVNQGRLSKSEAAEFVHAAREWATRDPLMKDYLAIFVRDCGD